MNSRKNLALGVLLVLAFLKPALAAPSFQQIGNTLVMSNVNVRLEYNLSAGTTDFYWQNSKKISAFYSGITFNTGYVKGINYSNWSYTLSGSNQAIVIAIGSGLPMMKQIFTLDQNDSFLVRVDASGTNLKANWMGPVVVDSTGGVNIGVTNDNRALVVPFDNDGFVRYNAMPMNSSGTGHEVGAFYDNTTRNGLVVGSVTHDNWKTGIFFAGANNKLNALNVYGGEPAPADVSPHGYVGGDTLSSPTMFVGFGNDWRVTMQNYAAENTNFAPKLPWTNGVPFGWNSYGVIQQNINYTDALAVSDFFYTNQAGKVFTNQGTVYINFDSFWDNLSSAQLQDFVNHCHARGEKAGIYWGPFVFWGSQAQGSNWLMNGSSYNFSAAYLRTASGAVQTLDGAIALDPTHPGTKSLMNYFINEFTNWGFDYVKLDFLSHGALEGVHYDPNVTTGIQAYNQGMRFVLNAINGRMFISESIAPLFPYQFSNSRRIACDAQTSLIGDTEYTMNSVSYGWWLDGVYQFNDPDLMVFANGADTNEAQSRLISGAVTGLMLNGDDLTTTNGRTGAQSYLGNAAINEVAQVGQTFTPVEGNTGNSAVNIFARQDGNTWCIAVFNYSASSAIKTVDLKRAGLPQGAYTVTNLWDGTGLIVTNAFNVSLNAKQSKLFRLAPRTAANLRWSPQNNTGVWDNGASANWINQSNSQQSVFNAGDQVLFDDTAGVPTAAALNGTVAPASVTINSSTNNFSFNGTGKISGTGTIVKLGSSTLALNTANDFTGSLVTGGGTVQMGAGSLNSFASLTVTNGGTLDFYGSVLPGSKPIAVSGDGVAGGGALYNSGGETYDQTLNITLLGNATFGGGHRWDLAHGSAVSGPYNVNLNLAGGYAEWDTVTLAPSVGNIEVTKGAFGIKGMGGTFGKPTNLLTVDTEVDFWNSNYGANSGYDKNIHVLSNAILKVLTSPSTFFNANVTLEEGASCWFYYGSGSGQTLNGTYVLNGMVHLKTEDGTVTFTNTISGPGGFVWDTKNNEIIFTASNTYSGPTIIGGGLTLGLLGNGSVLHSSLIFLGGSNPANIAMDVSGRADKNLVIASGQTLAGIGRVNGGLTVLAGATFSPAGTNITLRITSGTNGIGTLSATADILLQGTTIIKLKGSGTNDVVQSTAGSIVFGGTLNLVNLSSSPPAAGNMFQIFNASNCIGTFATIVPTSPGAGLAWDTTQMNSGILKVVLQPAITNAALSGGKLVFSGKNGFSNGSYVVMTSTNLGIPLTSWVPVVTNTFVSNGAFYATNLISSSSPQKFYRIQLK